MSRAIDWAKTYESLPEHERGAVLTALAKVEVKDPTGRWLFAERMAQAFGCFPWPRSSTSATIAVSMSSASASRWPSTRPSTRSWLSRRSRSKLVTKQQIIYLLAGESPRIALESHSMDSEVTIGGNVVGSAVGTGSTVKARDITAFINTVDQADGLDPELKRVLVAARKPLESGNLTGTDKDDAADDLGKLTDEIRSPSLSRAGSSGSSTASSNSPPTSPRSCPRRRRSAS